MVLDVGRRGHAVEQALQEGRAADRLEIAAAAQLLGDGDQVGRLVARAERGDRLEDLAVRARGRRRRSSRISSTRSIASGSSSMEASTACSASRFCGGMLPGSGAVSRSPRRGLRSRIVPVRLHGRHLPGRAGMRPRPCEDSSEEVTTLRRDRRLTLPGAAAISSAGAGGPSSRIFRSSCTSSQTTRFSAGFRSRTPDGRSAAPGSPLYRKTRPRSLPIGALLLEQRIWAAKRPSVQMTRGLRSSSWLLR